MVLPLFFEIASSGLLKSSAADHEIVLYFLFIATSLLFVVAIIYSTLGPHKVDNNFSLKFAFTSFELFVVTFAALIPFLFFIRSNLTGYSLIDIAVFSEEYRNGIYKGSGIYTAPLTHFLPTMLAINIALGSKFSRGFFISLFVIVMGTFVLGLRIYLLKVFLALLYRLTKSDMKLGKTFLIVISIFATLSIYKIYLGSNSDGEKSIYEYLLNPITRLNFSALVKFQLGYGLEYIYCLLPTMQYNDLCNGESFKYAYLANNPKISADFPFLSKFSGVAIPLPVYFYNMFGIFGTTINAVFISLIGALYFYIERNRSSTFRRIMAFIVLISISSAMVEDIMTIQFLDQSLIIGIALFVLIKVRNYAH
jgi:hypothetical protein